MNVYRTEVEQAVIIKGNILFKKGRILIFNRTPVYLAFNIRPDSEFLQD